MKSFKNKNEDSPAHTDTSTAGKKFEVSKYISTVPVVPQLSIALGLLVVIFAITYIGVGGSITKTPVDDVAVKAIIKSEEYARDKIQNVFDNITLSAKSALVWDVKNKKIIFNKNGDEQLPLASVTKLMTALVASELLNPNDTVPISLAILRTEGDSGLLDGERFSVQNIIDLTLITSSNDGAAALSIAAANVIGQKYDPEEIFVKAMNIRAEELGLTRTYFKNSTGLDVSKTEAGAYGTARDMARLMSFIITNTNDAVALTNTDLIKVANEKGAYHLAKNTNPIVNDIDGLIASKTGYTELAGGNLVVAFNTGLNRPVIVVILGSSYQGRFDDTLNLIERTRTYILNEKL